MTISTDENGAVLIQMDESGTPKPIGKIRGALNAGLEAGHKAAKFASGVTFNGKTAGGPRIRNTSHASMSKCLRSRTITMYHGEKAHRDGPYHGYMPIDLGRNKAKREMRAGLPRKQWPSLSAHRESR